MASAVPSASSPKRRARWFFLAWVVPVLLAMIALACYLVPSYAAYLRYEPKEGDVVFQSLPHHALIDAIEGATHSPYSHCGIVGKEDGGWYVYEAFRGVERTSLRTWCGRGRDGAFAVFRLREEYQPKVPEILRHVREYLGRPYDLHYRMDDEKIYCSELVYKAFLKATGKPLGKTVRFGELDWKPYRKTVESIEQGPAPVDREMITPRHLSEADALQLVYRYGYAEE